MIPRTWIIECLKTYQISVEFINFITNVMEYWSVELIAGGQTQVEVKIHRGIFQENSFMPLLFVIVMVPLTYLRSPLWATNFPNHKKRLITLIHRRHQAICKKSKRVGNFNTNNRNIQPGYRNGIEHRMLLIKSEKKETLEII